MAELDPAQAQAAAEKTMQDAQDAAATQGQEAQDEAEGAAEAPSATDGSDNDNDWTHPGGWGDGVGDDTGDFFDSWD
ncbi:MAG TPA: hypothetical protein VFH06_04140 [Candidatus Saccharimonadales bacterium]|nr:hypothetical protein [Candidatus Saccharimonadales bacterium]